jgi:hypothetical protein
VFWCEMRRRGSSGSEDANVALLKLNINAAHLIGKKSSGDSCENHSVITNGTATLLSSQLSPLWGEPGRRLPSVSSMLQLPPAALIPLPSTFSEDIEDFGKEDKQREDLLNEELVQASPRVQVEFSVVDTLCPNCRNPGTVHQIFSYIRSKTNHNMMS